MHLLKLTLAACAAALILPAAAQSAAISYDGDTLIYRADPGERNWIYVGDGPGGRVRLADSIEATYPADRCAEISPGEYACDTPARIRLELGDLSDRNGFSDGYVRTIPVDVFGGPGDDAIEAHHDAPTPVRLDGGDGADSLRGYDAGDVLIGGPGDDLLNGSGGSDELRGGDGNDTLKPDGNAAPSADIVDGGPGSDLLEDYVQYFAGGGVYPAVDLTLNAGADDGRPGEGDDVSGIERMTAYVSGHYVLTDGPEEVAVWANMNGGPSTVQARGGNDVVTGDDAVETIDGGAGDDRIEGGFNHDTLTGGPGRDLIYGDQTARCGTGDTVCVPYGNDVIEARDGEVDVIDCGPGNDRVFVDAIDVHTNCEMVEASGAAPPAAPGGQGQVGGGAPAGGPSSAGAAAALVGKPKLGSALRMGLKVKLAGARPGKGKITAKQGKRTVASGSVNVTARGTATVTLRFTPAARKSLRTKKSVTLKLSGAGVAATLTVKR